MGQYEPNDSRDVTQSKSDLAGEPPRTGPREDAARQRSQGSGDKRDDDKKGKEQFGYGDRNDAIAQADEGKSGTKPQEKPGAQQAGEGSDDPDGTELLVDEPGKVARADAQRPLGGE